MFGEEGIHGVPFGTAVVVFFIRKVGVGKPGLLAVEFVDKPIKGASVSGLCLVQSSPLEMISCGRGAAKAAISALLVLWEAL